jgi:Zn-dependent protease with chaperone function
MQTLSFQGGVFSDETSLGRVGVEINVNPQGLEARPSDGDAFKLSATQLVLEVGGASGKMVFCRNPEKTLTIFSEAPGFLKALAHHPNPHVQEQAVASEQALRTAQIKRGLGWTLSFLAIIAIGLWGLGSLQNFAKRAVHQVPWQVDETIGQTLVKQMDLGGPMVENLVVQDAANKILQRLVPYSARPDAQFEIHVVQSDQVNAFALPGGQMVIFTGLLKRAQKAEEVAGVLAHEIAHVTQRHGLDRIVQSIGIMTLVQLAIGDSSVLLGLGSELITLAAINSYSRDQETEADAIGVHILHSAGIAHTHLAQFFRDLKELGPTHGDKDTATTKLPDQVEEILSWVSTHPAIESRIEAIESSRGELGTLAPKPFDIDWKAVHQALQESKP